MVFNVCKAQLAKTVYFGTELLMVFAKISILISF